MKSRLSKNSYSSKLQQTYEKWKKSRKNTKLPYKNTKLKQYKANTKFLKESKDSTQFWHRYNKFLGKKANNTVEPIYDTESGLHIFDDKKI